MKLAMIGLGRMGGNMARRLTKGGHQVIGYARSAENVRELQKDGIEGATSLDAVVQALPSPRVVWIMVPAGGPTEGVVNDLGGRLSAGDMVIDGGNSYFKDDVRRGAALQQSGIHYVDVGTSGGVWGLERGYCMMIGGDTKIVAHLDPIHEGARGQ